jgi:hypothetical protein
MLYVDELAQYIGRNTANWLEKPVQNMSKKGRRFNSEQFIDSGLMVEPK